MIISHTIEIEKLYISEGHDFKGRFGMDPLRHKIPSVESVNCVAGRGIEGDRYFDYKDNWKGQITFLDRRTINELVDQLELGEVDDSVFRRNAIVNGLDLNELIGKTFRIGNVLLLGTEECSPCFWMDKVVKEGAHKFLKGRGGLRCRILESGLISIGSIDLEVLSEASL